MAGGWGREVNSGRTAEEQSPRGLGGGGGRRWGRERGGGLRHRGGGGGWVVWGGGVVGARDVKIRGEVNRGERERRGGETVLRWVEEESEGGAEDVGVVRQGWKA